MLYLFTGNSDFLVRQEVKAWKERFISKYGEFNLIHIKDIESVDYNFLNSNISASSFLDEKKLIIIDLIKDSKESNLKEGKEGNSKEEFLLKSLNNIAEGNIILINIINPDKRSKFYKKLCEIAILKEFSTKGESDIYSIVNNKYHKQISTDAINTIIKYKSGNLSKIISDIDKLLILFEFIGINEVVENIIPELEESIFQVVDDLLNKNKPEALKKIEIILNDTNIYAFYNNLIANLRTSIYILHLKNIGSSSSNINSILDLGSRGFLANKKYIISYTEAKKLYINLVNIDKKMKSGMLNGTEESDFKFELERQILS